MWDFTTNKVNSRSLRVLMTDDQAYNIWQSACISLLPKRKKHQSIHKWVVFLLIVYDSTVRSGDLFWLRLNLKHMERHNFLAGLCLPRNYAWPLPVVLLFTEGLRGIRGLLITLTQDASRGSWFKRGSDSVALVCFHMEWDTRLCTSVKTGTAVLSPKIVNCNKWYNCLLHIC